jgi:hypothetical protein
LQKCELWLPPGVTFLDSSVDEIPGLERQDDSNHFDWTSLIEDPFEKDNNPIVDQHPLNQEPEPVEEIAKLQQEPLCKEQNYLNNWSEPSLDALNGQMLEENAEVNPDGISTSEDEQVLPIDSKPEILDENEIESVPGLSPAGSSQGTFLTPALFLYLFSSFRTINNGFETHTGVTQRNGRSSECKRGVRAEYFIRTHPRNKF